MKHAASNSPNEWVRQYKRRTRLTVVELAEMFGVSYGSIEDYLYNRREVPPDITQTLLRFERDGLVTMRQVIRGRFSKEAPNERSKRSDPRSSEQSADV